MTIDHRITCEGQVGKSVRTLAATMVAIFPVGVPLALFILLFMNRDAIMHRETRSGDESLESIGEFGVFIVITTHLSTASMRTSPSRTPPHAPLQAFLFRLYQPKYWWLPVIDLVRRLVQQWNAYFAQFKV